MVRVIQDSDDEAEALTPTTSPARQSVAQNPSNNFYQTRIAQFNEHFAGRTQVVLSSESDELNRSTKRRKRSHTLESKTRFEKKPHQGVSSPKTVLVGNRVGFSKLPDALNNIPPVFMGSDLISTLPDDTYQQMQIVAQSTELVDTFDFQPRVQQDKIHSDSKSSSLPWTQIRAIEAADELSAEEQLRTTNMNNAINLVARNQHIEGHVGTHDATLDAVPDDLSGGLLDQPTFTPPGTPSMNLSKKSLDKKMEPKRKAKKKTKTVVMDEQDISEDELARDESPTVARTDPLISSPTSTKWAFDNVADVADLDITGPHIPSKVQVVISIANPVSPETKEESLAEGIQQPRLAMTSNPEAPMDVKRATSPEQIMTPLKRGRGRPKKSKDAVLHASHPLALEIPIDSTHAELENAGLTPEHSINQGGSFDEEIVAANQHTSASTEGKENAKLSSITTSSKTSSKPKSSQANGKAAHRVGLSKRVQIASLLRSVRK